MNFFSGMACFTADRNHFQINAAFTSSRLFDSEMNFNIDRF